MDKQILSKDTHFWPCSVSCLTLTIDGEKHEFEWADCMEDPDAYHGFTLAELEENFAEQLKNCRHAELFEETPLHDETYEYNKETKEWFLVKQGQGYA